MKTTEILLVDDHTIVREGLKLIIGEMQDMRVADEASNGSDTLELINQNSYDLVLLDISMPGINGLELIKQIKKINNDIQILILSMYPEDRYAIRAFKAGANGYLTKNKASQELIKAIRKVSNGGKYVNASLAEKMVSYLDLVSDKPLHENLSDREFEVMLSIVTGKKTKQIAEELSLSTRTVGTYRMRVLKKMNMKSNVELTLYAIENGIIN